ncbi:hypothetical protein GCM10011415_30430 [Salipiger pallidus]|uniref:PAS domain-containing protein n=2 Tax=Salipiger pallidus TaxID=1775170 RepID=A0A8J3EHL8_9RHOB|nr:hypothetical protein GCM10011415_30430 [Salipiger pallidus]
MLVKDGQLVVSTLQSQRLLDCSPGDKLNWTDITTALEPIFGQLPMHQPETPGSSQAVDDTQSVLSYRPEDHGLRMTLTGTPIGLGEGLRMRCDLRETELLRTVMDRAPNPIWLTSPEHAVIWSNAAYADVCDLDQGGQSQPPLALIPDEAQDMHTTRASVGNRETGTQAWFEVQSFRVPQGWLHFAQSIDSLIHAEATQRNFLQTLTRIFAHLPIALAVFDRNRRLVLFNPALLDLTGLPAEFLSGRPNLLSFFDVLRERHMMPEPKDYGSWRSKLRDLITAASNDLYTETWSLPSGLTYKMTGRPHPDGGIAFLFEDISSEISLTRRFRQEIEITRSVLDQLDDAIAVFSQLGAMTFCNKAYRALWESNPHDDPVQYGIMESTRDWQVACHPSPIWADLREFVLTLRDRASWDAEIITNSGKPLLCRAEPLLGGATMVRFSPLRDTPADVMIKLRESCT